MVPGCLGVLPETDRLDREVMEITFRRVVERWNRDVPWENLNEF